MHVPPGAEKFTFPYPQPVSPPVTPASSESRQSSISQISPIFAKRYGYIGSGDSPPEHLDPTGTAYQFSYTPPQRDLSSDSSSESDEVIHSDDEDYEPDVESYSEAAASVRQTSVRVRPVNDETDFTVEEMSENDMGYDSDTKPVQPDHIEDAESVKGNQDTTEVDQILVGRLKNLNCDNSSEQPGFEEVRQQLLRQRRKRWSKGGSHKRNHDESIGSGTDGDDIEPLDAQQPGSSARRLRRRTQGPEDRPRTSLLFEDPPAEIEELKHFDDDQDETSPLTSYRSDRPNNMHKDDHYDKNKYSVETVHSTDEEDIQKVTTQYWRYSTDVDSDLSRPSSSCQQKCRGH